VSDPVEEDGEDYRVVMKTEGDGRVEEESQVHAEHRGVKRWLEEVENGEEDEWELYAKRMRFTSA
jgi:hypothetical protein